MHFIIKASDEHPLLVGSLCFILPSFEPTRGPKEAAQRMGYNNVSSIRDYQWGQEHYRAKHTVASYKAQKCNGRSRILLVVIVEKIAPKCLTFIAVSS